MSWYSLIWLIWALFGLIFELSVLVFGIEGATLSEQVWKLRAKGGGWFSLLIFFLAWMIYHFVRENVSMPDVQLPGPELSLEGPDSPSP